MIIQSDLSVLVDKHDPKYAEKRDFLLCCAELEKCPEHVHFYRLTPLSLWNAAARGLGSSEIIESLNKFSQYPVPPAVRSFVADTMSMYGKVVIERDGENMVLRILDASLIPMITGDFHIRPLLGPMIDTCDEEDYASYIIEPWARGRLKVELIKIGIPAEDLAGYTQGTVHPISLRDDLVLRPYQIEALEHFLQGNSARGGAGVIALPCGSGKTVVGLAIMARLGVSTLIIASNVTSLRQWKEELLLKTSLLEEEIGEYSGFKKEIKPITVASYQIFVTRPRGSQEFPHLKLFSACEWGLIIYDEVHLLPAELFQITSTIQSRRRLGLTATLVREDHKEPEVFCLVGPKRYDVPWKILEDQGWIAPAECYEVSVPLSDDERKAHNCAEKRHRFRIAASAKAKIIATELLLKKHSNDLVLVIGMFLDQLKEIAQYFSLPLIDGSTPQKTRDELFARFRKGDIRTLVVSKVANFSVDLPEASVAIEVSGTFGSRQEEAQRLGRILRPKHDGRPAIFYLVIAEDSEEERFALNRQIFLVEQGYQYDFIELECKQSSKVIP